MTTSPAANLQLHADALATLRSWSAPSGAQEALRALFCAHLEANDDAVWRTCRPDHLTASALVMTRDTRWVALTKHAKANLWLQTGGHCESSDASLAQAALREAREETAVESIEIDPIPLLLSRHEVPFCGPIQPAHHLDVQFLAIVQQRAELVISGESDDLAWWPVSAAGAIQASPTDVSVLSLIAAARARLAENPQP